MVLHPQKTAFSTSLAAWPTIVHRSSTRVIRYNVALPAEFVDALRNRPEELAAAGKLMRRTKLREAMLFEWDSRTYVMKHYLEPSLRLTVKRTFGGSQAWRSYQMGCALADAGIRTPRPIACIENRWRRFQRDSYLLYPLVEGRTLSISIVDGHMNDADIQMVWTRLETLWQQLDSLHVGLRDANTGNFIVAPSGDLWLIDLDDSRIHRSATITRLRLRHRWCQLCRSMSRAVLKRDQHAQPVKCAA